ncbi:sensor histidine kinase [Paenibacillus thailandensis]|uniref:histidine kinase n=1 Tax=Paenibacillus thailandensis TaxID=393250 RepID=A0ABW5QWP9_9BACL
MVISKINSLLRDPPDGRRPLRGRSALRWGAFVLCAAYIVLFLWKIPSYYVYLRDVCLQSRCEFSALTPLPADAVFRLGLSNGGFAGLYTAISLADFAVYFLTAAVILRKRPKEPLSWIAAIALISFHTSGFIELQWAQLGWAASFMSDLSTLSFVLFLTLFPNGKIVVKPMFWFAVALAAARSIAWYFPDRPWGAAQWPIWLTLLWMLLLYGTIIWNQWIRYRVYAEVEEKQQTKWVVFGLSLSITGLLAVSAAPLLYDRHFYETASPEAMLALDVAVLLVMLPIPVTLGISMLRKRLWDIDPIVNRTLLYGCLSAAVVATYSLTVWYLSYLFRSDPGMISSLIGAGIVAVVFAPLKEKLQRGVNRLVYGVQTDPFSVLEKLGNRLKEPSSPEAVLDLVVRTVKDSLRLPYAAIHVTHQGEAQRMASAGFEAGGKVSQLPLVAGGQELGSLLVCTRGPEESFSDADWKLLNILARQAGVVVQGVKQAMDIRMLLGDLQEMREQLIFAREEERRSIRKNLHDDIAPRLAAMRLTSDLVVDWIRKDPNKAIDIMNKFKQDIGETVNEIRGIVYDLRPQALDELGLSGAIGQRVEQLLQLQRVKDIAAAEPLRVELDLPEQLPPLPAAVEVGAYRIVTEAMLNVVKHARASFCLVRIVLMEGDGMMKIDIVDNGVGLGASPAQQEGGLGLFSLRERAEELGGRCTIESAEAGGTHVSAALPLRAGIVKGKEV